MKPLAVLVAGLVTFALVMDQALSHIPAALAVTFVGLVVFALLMRPARQTLHTSSAMSMRRGDLVTTGREVFRVVRVVNSYTVEVRPDRLMRVDRSSSLPGVERRPASGGRRPARHR